MDESSIKLPANTKLLNTLSWLSKTLCLIAIVISIASLIGWFLRFSYIDNLLPHLQGMHPLSAISFLCLGFALLAQTLKPESYLKYLSSIFSLATITIGIISFLSFSSILSFGVNEFFFKERIDAIDISPNSAITFILIGISLLTFQFATTRATIKLAQLFTFLAAAISMLAIIGYAYQTLSFYEVGNFPPMPLSSAIASAIITIAILSLYASHGFTKSITRDTASSRFAFRLIIFTLIVPALLGFVFLQGIKLGYYDTNMGIALGVVGSILFISILIWLNATLLEKMELESLIIKKSLEDKNVKLEVNEKELATKIMSVEEERDKISDKLNTSETLKDITDQSD